jgi:hypothetical protein
MITIFRRIRQKLLGENKIVKYMLYAIGEILLVVIGILIAFQVNQWNEARKNRAYEVKMLTEVVHSLESDIEFWNSQMNIMEGKERIMNSIIEYKNGKIDRPDSLIDHLLFLERENFFQFNKGPYKALISNGMDRISNDSIRIQMIRLYDFFMPASEYMANNFLEPSRYEKITLITELIKLRSVVNAFGDVEFVYPEITRDILQTKKFEKFLFHTNRITLNKVRFLSNILKESRELRNRIYAEIAETRQ